MPLLMEQMSGVRSIGLTWLLPAGSATDPADRLGISTLWSELLLRGAGTLDSRAQADAFDALGVGRSADAATLHMRLSFSLLGDRLLGALPLIVDMVRRPRLEGDAIDASRDLALQFGFAPKNVACFATHSTVAALHATAGNHVGTVHPIYFT